MTKATLQLFKLLILCTLFTSGLSIFGDSNLLDLLTTDEIFSIFNTKRESVPTYELVQVHYGNQVNYGPRKRSIRDYSSQLDLQAFGKNISLYLEPTDHVLLGKNTPVYAAVKDNSEALGIKYITLRNVWSKDFNIYQDLNGQAAVTIFKEPINNNINVEGIIGDDLIIKPLPSRVQQKISGHFPQLSTGFKNQPNSYRTGYRNINDVPHIMYKSVDNHPITRGVENFVGTVKNWWDNLFDFRINNRRSKRAIFDTVYPQVLVIVDHETYKAHGKDIQALSRYLASFWNGVDLRYRDMSDPKIRLNIAGIIIPTEEGAAPYLEYHRRYPNLIEDRKTLEALGKYLYNDKRFSPDAFDVTVAITSLDMCMMESNVCNPAAKGLAYNGGACKHDVRYSDMSVAFLEDSGGFDGITTAAHELGHIFGAPHDGDDSLQYIGGPGAKQCSWDDGYLMSSKRRDRNGLHWSTCSIQAMQHFLKSEAYCLRDKPVVIKPVSITLPGKLMSRDEQCRRITNTMECKGKNYDCGALWCVKPNNQSECAIFGAPAEGSSCSSRGICINGDCVIEPRGLISTNY